MENEVKKIGCSHQMLRGSEVSIGHCVIVNEFDRPSGDLLAVIVDMKGDDRFWWKYLNADGRLDDFSKGRGFVCYVNEATPVQKFGVYVTTNRHIYLCHKMLKSSATYRDGSARKWQETIPIKYKIRPDVLALAKREHVPEWSTIIEMAEREVIV